MVRYRMLDEKLNSSTFSATSDCRTLENRFLVSEKLPMCKISDISESDTAKCICIFSRPRSTTKPKMVPANDNVYACMMYLFTTVPHPHGHWQLQELLGNQLYQLENARKEQWSHLGVCFWLIHHYITPATNFHHYTEMCFGSEFREMNICNCDKRRSDRTWPCVMWNESSFADMDVTVPLGRGV